MPRKFAEERSLSDLIVQWKAEQDRRRAMARFEPLAELPRFVAGADAAFSRDKATIFAAAVVYDRVEQRLVEVAHASGRTAAPYIPGYLSFREGPTVLAAIRTLRHPFGAVCFDGQGSAHPRRCGLATHLGVELDLPSIGCAKSRLIGTFDEPAFEAGSSSPLMDRGEQVGLVLRTRDGTRPIFISVGHRADLPTAAALVLACRTNYRIPEPTRQADIEVAKLKASHAQV